MHFSDVLFLSLGYEEDNSIRPSKDNPYDGEHQTLTNGVIPNELPSDCYLVLRELKRRFPPLIILNFWIRQGFVIKARCCRQDSTTKPFFIRVGYHPDGTAVFEKVITKEDIMAEKLKLMRVSILHTLMHVTLLLLQAIQGLNHLFTNFQSALHQPGTNCQS